jgi:large subunit ribosomal protein L3
MNALLAKKLGMTRVFGEKGEQVPVTVLLAGPCTVIQRKTADKDGYDAVQIGMDDQKVQRLTKAVAGHYAAKNVTPKKFVREIALAAGEDPKPGDTVTLDVLEGAGYVDVCGITKGRGFQGVMKRHDMSGQPAAHGHMMHRRPGSIGMREWPGRILKNKRMPGHMGDVNITTQNLRVVQIRKEDGVLLVHGSVPGPVGGYVLVRKSIKKAAKAS